MAASVQLEEVARLPISPDAIAFSTDSKRAVAIASGAKPDCIDLATGKLVVGWGIPKPAIGKTSAIKSAAFAPDGNLIASHVDQTIHVWDKSGSAKLRDFQPSPLGETFVDLRFFKRGEWVVGVGQKHIAVWEYKSGKRLALHPTPAAVKSLDVHADGTQIVSLDAANEITIWDDLTRNPLGSINTPKKLLTKVRFSPDGRRMLCLSQNVAEFSLVNPINGVEIKPFNGTNAKLVDAAFLPTGGGSRLVSVNADKILRVWTASGKLITSKAFDAEVKGFAISPDGHYAVLVCKADAIVYRLRS